MTQDALSNMIQTTEGNDRFLEKAYRDATVREHTRIGIPYQIRALRQQRGWSQEELGDRSGKPQNVISRLEDPEYGKLSLKTLLEMASAFDVALLVKFVPFSRFRTEFDDLSPANLGALSFADDAAKVETEQSRIADQLKEIAKQLAELAVKFGGDVSHLQEIAARIRSLDEANRQEMNIRQPLTALAEPMPNGAPSEEQP